MEKKILIVCGEPSGDLHGANLVKALKEINPNTKVYGVGGGFLQKEGVKIYEDIKDLATFGFFDAIKKIKRFLRLKKILLERIKEERPNAIILIDFSGFNLRFAKEINKAIPIFYYISPQVWASREGRIKTIKEYINKMIVIFKFEEEFYKRYGVDTKFVGHPLLDITKPSKRREEILEEFRLSKDNLTICLLPGSRESEVKMILPIMLKTCSHILEKLDSCQFIITKAKELDRDLYEELLEKFNFKAEVIDNRIYDCLRISEFALICSGTATIEATIANIPFVIIYKTDLLNYLLYRPQIRTPYIGMINILARKRIVEEFIQFRARPKVIAKKILEILKNQESICQIKKDLTKVREDLGSVGASKRAAEIILNEISSLDRSSK